MQEAAYNYQYDNLGNRWQQNLTAGSGYNSLWDFTDGSNQISNSEYVTYDKAGNITWDDYNTYTYDAENRIIAVSNAYGTYTYAYDAMGRRVEKTDNGAATYYYYDLAGHSIVSISSTGNWISGEVYAGGRHLATYGGSTTTFNHLDWLGTERARTSVAGGTVETCQSLAFGDGFSCAGGDTSQLHFMGQLHDYETANDYFGARYYNSRYARFVTPDWSATPVPIPYADLTNPQTLNQYVFVQDNPNTFADLDGHEDDDGGGDGGGDDGGQSSTNGACNGTGTTNCSTPQPPLRAAQNDPPVSRDVLGDSLIGALAGGITSAIDSAVSSVEDIVDSSIPGASQSANATDNIVAPKEGSTTGAETPAASGETSVNFGHGGRHLGGTGLSQGAVQNAIQQQVQGATSGSTVSGSFWGRVNIGGQIIEYRAMPLADGTINVGTYYPVNP